MAVGLLLGIVATSCSGGDVPAEPGAATVGTTATDVAATVAVDVPGSDPVRVALVAPSAADDRAWTQSMVDSLDRLSSARAVETTLTVSVPDVGAAADALRAHAADGADLVIAHGTQYAGVVEEVAAEFADVAFAFGATPEPLTAPNVFVYAAAAGEGGYVNGVLAAELSESGTIGVVGPVPVADAQRYVAGFEAGVAAQDPSAEVVVRYIDSFSDERLAGEAAAALVAAGADVLTGISQMVPGATAVADDAGVAWFGTQSEQTDLAPAVVVASQVYRWDGVLGQMLDAIAAGSRGGQAYTIALADGGLTIVYNPGFDIDPVVRAAADGAIAGLVDGSIVLPG